MLYRKLPKRTDKKGGKFSGINLDIPGSAETEIGYLECVNQTTQRETDLSDVLSKRK